MNILLAEGDQFESVDGSSILDSALCADVVLEHSCKNGRCGVCKTKLLDGRVMVLRDQEALSKKDVDAGYILTCCCEAETNIQIDAANLEMFQKKEIRVCPARISSLTELSDNIIQVTLRLPPTATFDFLEGQFVDVTWNGIKRSYSIASCSDEREIMLLIKRVEGGLMSDYWFGQAQVSDLLRIEGPKGTFVLRDKSAPIIFLATGTGIAPIRSILSKLEKHAELSHPIYLFWGNRSAADFVWCGKFDNIVLKQIRILSQADECWSGDFGYVQDYVESNVDRPLYECQVYACGSNEMIIAAKEKMLSLGVP